MSFSLHPRPAAAPAAVARSAQATEAAHPGQAQPARRARADRSRSAPARSLRHRAQSLSLRAPHPELCGLIALASLLNLWALSRNGWANDYYSAAVRSMSSSWHDFLFASLDPSGVMTVDKPPLALWVQALSVRVLGYHPLSVLVPQALMGVASVVLVYDLVRRRFGRIGGFAGGLALALTPISVAISRHNNPDALLVLCSVAALWCAVRALEDGRTRWLALAGVCVGLGFETKMGVALAVVPGIAAAWLWISPAGRGRGHALGQLLAGGLAMLLVGGAWPALVELVPAADRPWVSGTSDNRVLSLIFEYNGLGRVDGQAGGPGGTGGSMFGGSPGPLRLLNSALGGQAGWLLGFAAVGGVAILVSTRLRRSDPRTGWAIAVGGAFLVTAALFSEASGIFHPYYVSLLAPFAAALVGAGAAELLGGGVSARIAAPLAAAVGCAVELAILAQYPGQLTWLAPVPIVVGACAAVALAVLRTRTARMTALGALLAALMIAPAAWAFDTLGHATSGTFPAGGPASIADSGGPGGGPGGPGGAAGRRGAGATPPLFGPGTAGPAGAGRSGETAQGARPMPGGPPPGAALGAGAGSAPPGAASAGRSGVFGRLGGPIGAPMGATLTSAVADFVKAHGGGTIAVASQSSAASAIISDDVQAAGIGGFSGRESDVSVSWLAQEVRSGKIRWVLAEADGSAAAGPPGDTRAGSAAAMQAAARACKAVTISGAASGLGTATSATAVGATATATTLYDCQGRASALQGAANA